VWLVPKAPTQAELDALAVERKKHAKREKSPKAPRKSVGKGKEDPLAALPKQVEVSAEQKEELVAATKVELLRALRAFDTLANEGEAVQEQVEKALGMAGADMDLDDEVEEDEEDL
jgi:hypothetical protein